MRQIVLAFVAIMAAVPGVAQTPNKRQRSPTARTVRNAPLPRTPDGRPDLQGIWTISTLTPLERPKQFENKAYFSEAEEVAFQNAVRAEIGILLGGEENRKTNGDQSFGVDFGVLLPDRRTSLITEPPTGKIPPLLPDAQHRFEASINRMKQHPADGPEDYTLEERCLLFENQGSPPIVPVGGNPPLQIVQTRDYVMILAEMFHDARVIPLEGRPHLPSGMRQWKGDSRGKWEGDTLVVDTTNFAAKRIYSPFDRLRGSDEALHVTERFTLVNADTILYRFTVDDPTAYTAPWTAELPWTRTNQPMFEFACHEGNYSLKNSLTGARAEERRQAVGAK